MYNLSKTVLQNLGITQTKTGFTFEGIKILPKQTEVWTLTNPANRTYSLVKFRTENGQSSNGGHSKWRYVSTDGSVRRFFPKTLLFFGVACGMMSIPYFENKKQERKDKIVDEYKKSWQYSNKQNASYSRGMNEGFEKGRQYFLKKISEIP